MADIIIHNGDGVIELDTNHKGPTTVSRAPVTSIIVSGETAGAFQVRLNNTTFLLVTGTADLTKQVLVRMSVNEIELVALPTAGKVYITLDQMP